jgi:hypothetical protein
MADETDTLTFMYPSETPEQWLKDECERQLAGRALSCIYDKVAGGWLVTVTRRVFRKPAQEADS